MRLIFAGTPEFARVAAQDLHTAGFDIALVLTQPDRPAGRGMKLQASTVKQWALDHHVPVAQPKSLRLDGKYPEDAIAARTTITEVGADAMVVAAYGLILPLWVLDTPRLGCFNIHGSLLPRWRGAAPIHRAIEAGDDQTGITIMQMDAGLDTGDILALEALPIATDDSTDSLHDKLAALGGRMMVDVLRQAAIGGLSAMRQPESGVTYAAKIEKREAALNLNDPADLLARRIRAFTPFPGASAVMRGEVIKFFAAQVLGLDLVGAAPGTVLAAGSSGVDIATGVGVLRITRLQKAGGKVLDVADFLRGFDIQPGMVFSDAVAPGDGR